MISIILILSIALIITLLLYLSERKHNKILTQKLHELQTQNAVLQQKAKLSDDLKQILDGQIVQYLSKTNDHLLNQAKDQFQNQISAYQDKFEKIVQPFRQLVEQYDKNVKEFFEKSAGKFGSLDNALQQLQKTSQLLQKETANLVNVFKNSQLRGKWGELQFQQLLEAAGFKQNIHYLTQFTTKDKLRPDFIIKLPDNKNLIVDVKIPIDDYFKYIETDDPAQKQQYAKAFVDKIRKMTNVLAKKDYRKQIPNSFDFIVLYIPLEAAFAFAINYDFNLYSQALDKKILIASPTTFMPILQIINLLWERYQTQKNADQIIDLAQKLRNRYNTLVNHISELGKNLDRSVSAYNSFINSWKSRFEPTIRDIEKLSSQNQDLTSINPIESNTQPPNF